MFAAHSIGRVTPVGRGGSINCRKGRAECAMEDQEDTSPAAD